MSSFKEKPLRVERISMVPIKDLRPHERIDAQELEAFVASLKTKGVFYKPILATRIDDRTYMIIDGTHRWAGLKKLGAEQIPTILLDYENDPEIKLSCWHPVTETPIEQIVEIVKGEGVKMKEMERKQALDRIEESAFILLSQEKAYLVSCSPREHEDLFQTFFDKGFSFIYADTEERALVEVEKGKTVFIRKPPKKREVVKIVANGGYMPPKGTNHWLPYKYQHIYYKLEDLI